MAVTPVKAEDERFSVFCFPRGEEGVSIWGLERKASALMILKAPLRLHSSWQTGPYISLRSLSLNLCSQCGIVTLSLYQDACKDFSKAKMPLDPAGRKYLTPNLHHLHVSFFFL